MFCKVLVIGAGISGLNCSKLLHSQKDIFDVTVVEGGKIIGGRICTLFGGDACDTYRLEMGANWIHGMRNNPIYAIAKENGLLKKFQEQQACHRYERLHLLDDGSQVPGNVLRESRSFYGKFRNEADEFFETGSVPHKFGKEPSVKHFIECKFKDVWKERGYTQPEMNERKVVMEQSLKFESSISGCDNMGQVSLQQFGSYEELDYANLEVYGGYIKVVQSVAENIPKDKVLLNTSVTSIEYGQPKQTPCMGNRKAAQNSFQTFEAQTEEIKPKVKVKYSDGQEHYFDHVVFTGSLGYLKHNHKSLFIPPLPAGKQRAISALGIGIVDKIFLQFENLNFLPERTGSIIPYWNKTKLNGNTNSNEDVAEWTRKLNYFSVVSKPNPDTLEVWITGHEAEFMETLSVEQIGEDCRKMLQKFLKVPVPQPVKVIRTTWGSNPYTRGSYSYVAVGSTVKHIDDLAKPIYHSKTGKPLILFAGEATHNKFYSTVHGAYLSGERAAQTLIDYYCSDQQPATSKTTDTPNSNTSDTLENTNGTPENTNGTPENTIDKLDSKTERPCSE